MYDPAWPTWLPAQAFGEHADHADPFDAPRTPRSATYDTFAHGRVVDGQVQDGQIDDLDESFDHDNLQMRAALRDLQAKQQREQARLVNAFRNQAGGPPPRRRQWQQPAFQSTVQPPVLQQLQQSLRQMQQSLHGLQQQVVRLQFQRAPSPWAGPSPWTSFSPYGCGAFAPRFHSAYVPPFAPSCSPYGFGYTDCGAYSPFGALGSTLECGLAGLIGFGLGAAIC